MPNADPFAVLGPHRADDGKTVVIRARHPARARSICGSSTTGGARADATAEATTGCSRRNPAARRPDIPDYRLRHHVVTAGSTFEIDDPYRYGRVLTDFDLHLFGEGTHHRAFEKLGAHRMSSAPTTGVHFAVWAPNAHRVSVVGDFNGWDGRVHPMRLFVPSGVWELFIPDLRGRRKIQVRDPHAAPAIC